LPTAFQGSASDTPSQPSCHLSCRKARPGTSAARTNCRQVQQWTTDLAARLEAHASGTGARLIEVITRAGLGFTLARTWPQTTRDREDLLKHIGDARRFCPECGVTPRQGPAVVMPERRRSLYELERDGTWLDGTPLPEITTHPVPTAASHTAASRKENQMFQRQRRAAARREAAGQVEADRLFALADELDKQSGERPDYRRQITTQRAARIRRELGKDVASEAAAQAAEPTLHGADLDAEIDRLAGQFPEPEPLPLTQAPGAEPGVDAVRWTPHGAGDSPEPGPEAATTAGTGTTHRHAQQHYTGWVPGAPDHLYGAPERNEPDPETGHFGRAAPEPEDAGRFPLPRVLETTPATLAPVAATLPDGSPHADPFLAGRGWQARSGLYVRQPQAHLEAG